MVIVGRLRNQPICAGELIQAVESLRRNARVVERRITRHQTAKTRDNLRGGLWVPANVKWRSRRPGRHMIYDVKVKGNTALLDGFERSCTLHLRY